MNESANHWLSARRCLARPLLLVSLMMALCTGGLAQDPNTSAANFLLGVIFKLEAMHDSAGDHRFDPLGSFQSAGEFVLSCHKGEIDLPQSRFERGF